jgi:hypothetical protein
MTKHTALPALPAIPEPKKTAAEIARDREARAEISRLLRDIRANQVEQNLGRALRLVQMAQRGQGPLIDFFTEVGFKYADLADSGPVVEGARRRRLIERESAPW